MDPIPDHEIPKLTTNLKKGSESAWRIFHDHYSHRIAAFIHQHTNDQDAIPDILQETLCRIVRHIRKFPTENHLWCWLTRLARSAATDHYRKRQRHDQALHRLFENHTPTPSIPNIEPHLTALSKTSRILIEEKYFHGYTVKEIAKLHSSTPKKIAHALDAARKTLKQLISS